MPVPRIVLFLACLAVSGGAAGPPETEIPLPETLEWSSEVGKVEFLHRAHAEDFGIECVTCHHETDASPLRLPHPRYFEGSWEECARCHREEKPQQLAQSCSACHPDAPFTVADETSSSKVVIHESCWRCHEVGSGAEASSQCGFCHQYDERSSRSSVEPGAR